MPESQTLKGFALDVKPKVHPIPNQSFRCKYLYDLGLVAQSGDFSGPVTKVQGLTGQVHETGALPWPIRGQSPKQQGATNGERPGAVPLSNSRKLYSSPQTRTFDPVIEPKRRSSERRTQAFFFPAGFFSAGFCLWSSLA